MEWCLGVDNHPLLLHIQTLGYPLSHRLFTDFPVPVGRYLLTYHPLVKIPKFELASTTPPPEPESGELVDLDASIQVQDDRPLVEVKGNWFLNWKDLSLYQFSYDLLNAIDNETIQNLVHIDISHNNITSLAPEIFQLLNLESLNVSHNMLSSLPTMSYWQSGGPKILLASHNCLESRALQAVHIGCQVTPKMWYLDLSYNSLSTLPPFIHACSNLEFLHLEGNEAMGSINSEVIMKPTNLKQFSLPDKATLNPPLYLIHGIPSTEKPKQSISEQMRSLHVWSRHRVVVVGPKSHGKSSFVAKVIDKVPTIRSTTLCIKEWKIAEKYFKRNEKTIELWEFRDDPESMAVHACFRCYKSFHVVIFDAMLHTATSSKLFARTLCNIQVGSEKPVPVLVVFTRVDLLRKEKKEQVCQLLLSWTKNGGEYSLPVFPQIISVHFISCKTGEGVENIRKYLPRLLSQQEELLQHESLSHFGITVPLYTLAIDAALHDIRRSEKKKKMLFPLYALGRVERMVQSVNPQLKDVDLLPSLMFLHEVT